MKCLYLLVCLPARDNSAPKEETFQDLLTQVNHSKWKLEIGLKTRLRTGNLQQTKGRVRAATIFSGIAYIDYNGFYYFQQPFRCRAASVTVLVEALTPEH